MLVDSTHSHLFFSHCYHLVFVFHGTTPICSKKIFWYRENTGMCLYESNLQCLRGLEGTVRVCMHSLATQCGRTHSRSRHEFLLGVLAEHKGV